MGCGSGWSRCCRRRRAGFAIRVAKPVDDRLVLQGILFVLHTGIGWEHLPQELGFGCGIRRHALATCGRTLWSMRDDLSAMLANAGQ
jgi:transposase